MSAYYIITQTVTDMEKFARDYVAHVLPFLARHGAEVIVSEFDAKPLQGTPAKCVAVIRFPSEQAIESFLEDPGYQPLLKIRLDLTTNAHAVMAPAFRMPG